MNQPIYMDNHATTPVDPRVVQAMLPWWTDQPGNASSVGHAFGEQASQEVDRCQATIAKAIGASAEEIVFTSGATESNNLAIRGVAERTRRRGDHIVSVATEHEAVVTPLGRLGRQGRQVTLLPVETGPSPQAGRIHPQQVADAITDSTCLVSVMLANNEIGTIQPLAEIGQICRERSVLLHCDATQAVGKIPVDVRALGVDLLSFTAHKLYGPKGIGVLFVRGGSPTVRIDPQIIGGGQQAGRRGGTLNVPGIVGLAHALQLCDEQLQSESERLGELRDQLASQLIDQLPEAQLCGPALDARDSNGQRIRLAHNLVVTFPGLDSEAIQMQLQGLAVSSGAACSSAAAEPSHVLQAIGLTPDQARSSLRFGLGRFNTPEHIPQAVEQIVQAVNQLKQSFGR